MVRLSYNFLSCRWIGYHSVLIHVSLPIILQVLTNISLPAIIHVLTISVYRLTNMFSSCQFTGYHTISYQLSHKFLLMSVYRLSYEFTGYNLRFYTWQCTSYYQVLTNVNVPATIKQLLTHSSCKFLPVSVYQLLLIVLHKLLSVSPDRLSEVLTYIRQVLTQVSVPTIIQRLRVYEVIFTWRRVFGSWNLPFKRHREIFAEIFDHDKNLVLTH